MLIISKKISKGIEIQNQLYYIVLVFCIWLNKDDSIMSIAGQVSDVAYGSPVYNFDKAQSPFGFLSFF